MNPPENTSNTINLQMSRSQWGLIFLLSVIWGGSFFFIGIAVRELPPITIATARSTLAALFLLAAVKITGHKFPASPKIWRGLFLLGILNVVLPHSLIVWGQGHIGGSTASVLNGMTPVFGVILAHFYTRDEKFTLNRGAGVLIGWIGVAVLIGVSVIEGSGIEILGQLAIVAASFSYSAGALLGRRYSSIHPLVLSAGMVICSSVVMIPGALLLEQPWQYTVSASTWLALLGLGIFCSGFAYLIYFRVLAKSGATNLMLVTFLIPVSAIILSMTFLGDRPGWNVFAGMGLILTALICIDGRIFQKKDKHN